ncbi:UDP-N-acetylglucosamine--N-acetylmuramyl-(pentapeptide) pyrophosphoryl-undecaprenol N-acetylglucosamine transferase [Candidatus Uhrbacteria bacterium]|nr:UDP-N-acetylglucosamine--N-acetylmuramyl-(pentapeptide) pyrophosphoryl-undecaprenol N-acetylglucosamine transferase [Candidatus Uhrbacteria bacterium]
MKILLTGGGTLGSVTPLLALVEAWRKRDVSVEFVWIGTKNGPERKLVEEEYAIRFFQISVARFPRYFSIELLFLPIQFLRALIASVKVVIKEKPNVVIGAGGFTQVPVIFSAWIFGVSSAIFQTDVQPLLSNKLVIPFVKNIFVAWKQTVSFFLKPNTKHPKPIFTGVPVRESLLHGSKGKAIERFHLDKNKLTVLVFGGGTGAEWLNEQIFEIAPQLCKKANILHLTGIGKRSELAQVEGYVAVESLGKEMADVYAVADLVVARAGIGTIAELSALRKPAILIPLPNSIQEDNASALKDSARVLVQENITSEILLKEICLLLNNSDVRTQYSSCISSILRTDVADDIIDYIVTSSR